MAGRTSGEYWEGLGKSEGGGGVVDDTSCRRHH